jgi:hypothetical protein
MRGQTTKIKGKFVVNLWFSMFAGKVSGVHMAIEGRSKRAYSMVAAPPVMEMLESQSGMN